MKEGCKYHKSCYKEINRTWNWTVPVFQLSEPAPIGEPDSPKIDEGAVLPELFPSYNGTKWSLQTKRDMDLKSTDFSANIGNAVQRYLAGLDDMEDEGSDMHR